jgi:microcompartment protein CcmK/EutM
MQAHQILSLVPDDILKDLAIDTGVNKYSKKLQGQLLFKLLIYSIINYKDNSLRKMESAYESIGFGLLYSGVLKKKIKFNSISERLNTISFEYFEKLYFKCVDIYAPYFPQQSALRFDSTIVSLSTKLLKVGYHLKGGDAALLKQLKFTIGYNGMPFVADFYPEQQYTSENVALKETILKHACHKTDGIRVFDKGITARKTHDQLTANKIPFVSCISEKSKRKIIAVNKLGEGTQTDTLIIISDTILSLYSTNGKAKYPVRCIEASVKKSGETICFITNIYDLDAITIVQIYKQRWDIEIFFKFLKQELNFSHLINRSENGIKVMLYATLIASILLLVYKETNKLSGYKIMKHKFINELEKSIAIIFVEMCGGDIKLANKILNINSS